MSGMEAPVHELDALFAQIETPQVLFFPIRHHSPACAFHLKRLIQDERPASILIEGPDNFDSLLPVLMHPESRAPFAVYTSYLDKRRRLVVRDPAAVNEPVRTTG